MEADASVWWNVTIRGDNDLITLGENVNVQDGSRGPHRRRRARSSLEKNVSVGHLVMLHGCTIGENSLIGIGAIVLNRAVIGKNCLVGAGATVTEGKVIPDGSLVLGVNKVVRTLTPEEIAMNTWIARALRRARGDATARASSASDDAPADSAARSRSGSLLLAYASLYPFVPLRLPVAASRSPRSSRGRATSPRFDVTRERPRVHPARHARVPLLPQGGSTTRSAILKATLFGAAFSFCMETAQLFIPGRIASIYDTIANTAGTLLGALVFAEPCYSIVTRPLGETRERS